jgi:hypothetical protein
MRDDVPLLSAVMPGDVFEQSAGLLAPPRVGRVSAAARTHAAVRRKQDACWTVRERPAWTTTCRPASMVLTQRRPFAHVERDEFVELALARVGGQLNGPGLLGGPHVALGDLEHVARRVLEVERA